MNRSDWIFMHFFYWLTFKLWYIFEYRETIICCLDTNITLRLLIKRELLERGINLFLFFLHLIFGSKVLMSSDQSLGKRIFWKLLWMALSEKLSRSLAKLCDLHFKCDPLDWVLHSFEIDTSFISHWMKEVEVFNGSLLVPKDQIYP